MKRLILILFCILFVSCSNESVIDSGDLVGVWAINLDPLDDDLEQSITYEFRTDGSMEVQTIIQTNEGANLGFRYRAIGTYAVASGSLFMNREKIYSLGSNNVEFVESLEELILSGEQWDEIVKATIGPDGRSLTFDYGPCNDTFNCIGTLELTRTD